MCSLASEIFLLSNLFYVIRNGLFFFPAELLSMLAPYYRNWRPRGLFHFEMPLSLSAQVGVLSLVQFYLKLLVFMNLVGVHTAIQNTYPLDSTKKMSLLWGKDPVVTLNIL